MRCKAYWDLVKVSYGEIDYLSEALHRAIYGYVGKDNLNPEQELTLKMLCRAYKHWFSIQEKGQPGVKFTAKPVQALVNKYQEKPLTT